MFRMLFRRAQATVDRAIDGLMLRVIVAIPFLIAAGFGTAALAIWLNREYGPETGSLGSACRGAGIARRRDDLGAGECRGCRGARFLGSRP